MINGAYSRGSTNFPKIKESPQNSRHQNCDMRQEPNWGFTNFWCPRTKSSHPGDLVPGNFALLLNLIKPNQESESSMTNHCLSLVCLVSPAKIHRSKSRAAVPYSLKCYLARLSPAFELISMRFGSHLQSRQVCEMRVWASISYTCVCSCSFYSYSTVFSKPISNTGRSVAKYEVQ